MSVDFVFDPIFEMTFYFHAVLDLILANECSHWPQNEAPP